MSQSVVARPDLAARLNLRQMQRFYLGARPRRFSFNLPRRLPANINQAMRTRLRLLLFLGSLFIGSWPGMLHADQPEQMPHAPSSSSFLLVASQQIADPRFRQTVILVTMHGNTGPIGVIINRPQDITLDKIFPAYPAAKNFNLFNGGPAYPKQISFLVRGADAAEGALTISGNIYLAYDVSLLDELLNGKRHYTGLRVMHGLASWAPGQLEYEIKLGDWFVMPLDEAVIFDRPPAEIWQELQSHAAVM
jgi:putative transcriptional regulator